MSLKHRETFISACLFRGRLNIDVTVACKVLKFADDRKIYRVVNSQEDIESLRNDLRI